MKEYVIWAKIKGGTDHLETVFKTSTTPYKSEDVERFKKEAENVGKELTRISTIDLETSPDFSKTLNRKFKHLQSNNKKRKGARK